MDSNIFLYGASGHCKVVIDCILSQGNTIAAILDDNPKFDTVFGIPVMHSEKNTLVSDSTVLISVGNNAARKRIAETNNVNFHTAIHRTAVISPFAKIGAGSVIMAGALINPDALIGKHCIVNTGAVIEHDCEIADYSHISPNASLAGNVTVGEGAHIGIGACIIQGIKVGKWAKVGAGAVIIHDVPDYAVVVGTPGKIIRYDYL